MREFVQEPVIVVADGFSVWAQIVASLAKVRSIFAENKKVAEGLRQFTSKLISSATEEIGWEFGSNEDYLTGQLRALLISAAGGAGRTAYVPCPNKHAQTVD